MSDRTQEIRERLGAATPGPWALRDPNNAWTGIIAHGGQVEGGANICGMHDGGQTHDSATANAHFIANAPSDIEYLLNRVEELERYIAFYQDQEPIEDEINVRVEGIPAIPYPGGHTQDFYWDTMARNLEHNYPVGGSNVRAALAKVCRNAARVLRGES